MTEAEFMSRLFAGVVAGIDAEAEEEQKKRIMEPCGKACAQLHGSIEFVKACQQTAGDTDDLLAKLNRNKDFWCGEWLRE